MALLPVMYGVRCAQAGGALEHIDIRLPAGGGGSNDNNDNDNSGGNGNIPNVNINARGTHHLQLCPLPANTTMEEVLQVSLNS